MKNRIVIRNTQEQRTAETRERLERATLNALYEIGYSRLATVDIARYAGVSRGALRHHFSGKEELIIVSVDRFLSDAAQKLQDWFRTPRRGVNTDGFPDFLWRFLSDRLMLTTIELVVEARHNEVLRTGLAPIMRAFYSALKKAWHEYFQGTLLSRDEAEAILDATINLIKGSAVQAVFQPKKDYDHKLKVMWKEYIAAMATPRIQ